MDISYFLNGTFGCVVDFLRIVGYHHYVDVPGVNRHD